jgi:adenylate cyclase
LSDGGKFSKTLLSPGKDMNFRNMKLIILAGIFFLTIHPAHAQKEGQPLADSLEQVLKRADISETERVDVLAILAYEYRNLLPRKAIAFGEQAELLAKKIHYEKKLGEIYLCQAYAYGFFSDIIKSYELALLAVKYNTEFNVRDMLPLSKLVAIQFNPNTSNEKLHSVVLQLLPEVNTIQDKVWYIRTIGGFGNAFNSVNDTALSDSLIRLAIAESQKHNQKFMEAHNIARLSDLFFLRQQYDSCLYLSRKTNAYFESIQEKRICSENFGGFSDIFLAKAKTDKKYLDSALVYSNLSLQKAIEIEYQTRILGCYQQLYLIHKEKGDSKNTIKYLEKFISLNDSLYGQNARSKIEGIAIKQRDEIADAQLQLKDAEVAQQKIYSYAALSGIALITLLLFFDFKNYRNQKKSTEIIIHEKQRSEELLLNILPAEMAEELKTNGSTKAKAFTMVTVMFTDFKDFTGISEKVSAELLVDEIHHCFSAFDLILQKYKIEKIKTIGDAYMCASGLPVPTYTHALDMIQAAIEIRNYMLERKKEKEAKGEIPFLLRIGIHTGPVVAGIVGVKKYAYDIWGDTVNLAARMEQNSESGKINISGSTYELVKEKYSCVQRGKIEAKNKGEIEMYFVEG